MIKIKVKSFLRLLAVICYFLMKPCCGFQNSGSQIIPNDKQHDTTSFNRASFTKPDGMVCSLNSNTLLRYKRISQEEELGTSWVGKWCEEFFQSKSIGPIDHLKIGQKYSSKGDINSHRVRLHTETRGRKAQSVEKDLLMRRSPLIHYYSNSTNELLNDIEILPAMSPMLLCLGTYEKNERHDVIHSNISKQKQHFRKKWNIPEQQFTQMALSIASNIETPEQWVEFCDNEGGLRKICVAIHSAAEEINEKSNDLDDLNGAESRERRFQSACSACRILRDLCSRDQNWSSVITDELLVINSSDDIISDLVAVLRHSIDAEISYTRKVSWKRRELRKAGVRIKKIKSRKERRDSRRKSKLYITQLFLAMAIASDNAVDTFRETEGLIDIVKLSSSYAKQERLRSRATLHPRKIAKQLIRKIRNKSLNCQTDSLSSVPVQEGIVTDIQSTSNKLLAALGHNVFVRKSPGQKGLRILSLDGGGSRGVASISVMKAIVEAVGGVEVCDSFDVIAGTSTGAILAFLVGLRMESNNQAKKRYDELLSKIFIKGALSTPMLFLTTASYSEAPFKQIMTDILGDKTMLDSRANPKTPFVFAASAKLSSTNSELCLFRNYNYSGGEKEDKFIVDPDKARKKLGYTSKKEGFEMIRKSSVREASRHEGSFRVLQRAALRATTAAPTVFKPLQLAGDLYSDGGLFASNPTAVAIHEARTLFPEVPIEMVVSIGTGKFDTEKTNPSFGWDGIVSQIVKSATETAKTHWVLEDIFCKGNNENSTGFNTKYFRFDPSIGSAETYRIDTTDPVVLEKLAMVTEQYMQEPEEVRKLNEIASILEGRED